MIRDNKKMEVKETLESLLNTSNHNRTQRLTAIFSWLKTTEEVNQFEKDYFKADPILVEQLVAEFKNKKK